MWNPESFNNRFSLGDEIDVLLHSNNVAIRGILTNLDDDGIGLSYVIQNEQITSHILWEDIVCPSSVVKIAKMNGSNEKN